MRDSKVFCVYILSSYRGVLYTGVTSGLATRVERHRTSLVDSFAKKYKTLRLVYYEVAASAEAAIASEKQIKGWRRSKKVALIEAMNPYWKDLAEEKG